jgi:hypothetical protein
MGRNHRITDWNPEDTAAWEGGNNAIARRNLLCTVAGDHVAFSIWSLWSVMALFMPASVYGFSAGDKLLLGAVATLVGGCVRIPYTLGVAAFGGLPARVLPQQRHGDLRVLDVLGFICRRGDSDLEDVRPRPDFAYRPAGDGSRTRASRGVIGASAVGNASAIAE